MEFEKLILRKEEIPILYENCFQVPIHPKLLDPTIKLDENIAKKVFAKAADEWYNELVEYADSLEEKNTQRWIREVFIKKKPKIKKEYGRQKLDTLYWEDSVFNLKNGFASSLSINRNAGGTLYFNRDTIDSEGFALFNSPGGYIRFSKDKALEFSFDNRIINLGEGSEGVNVHIYNLHNVDHYPGALFLRNWALLYLNEAMKQVLG